MWRTMQAEPSTSVPYMAHDAVKVLSYMKRYQKIISITKNLINLALK